MPPKDSKATFKVGDIINFFSYEGKLVLPNVMLCRASKRTTVLINLATGNRLDEPKHVLPLLDGSYTPDMIRYMAGNEHCNPEKTQNRFLR